VAVILAQLLYAYFSQAIILKKAALIFYFRLFLHEKKIFLSKRSKRRIVGTFFGIYKVI
jgi:hypothetical protein